MDESADLFLHADKFNRAENVRELARIMEALEVDRQLRESQDVLRRAVANPTPSVGSTVVVKELRSTGKHKIIETGENYVARRNAAGGPYEDPAEWTGWFITDRAPNGIYLGPEVFRITWVYPHTRLW